MIDIKTLSEQQINDLTTLAGLTRNLEIKEARTIARLAPQEEFAKTFITSALAKDDAKEYLETLLKQIADQREKLLARLQNQDEISGPQCRYW